MVSKPTGRLRGRPRKSIADDGDRYVLSFLEAKHMFTSDRFSKNVLSRTLVVMQFGQIDISPENLERISSGQKFKVVLKPSERKWRGDAGAAEFKKKSIFDLISEDRLRKIRTLKKDHLSPDFLWFRGMVKAWMIALNPDLGVEADLEKICASLNEQHFCEKVLKPWFHAALGKAPIPELRPPDFFPREIS